MTLGELYEKCVALGLCERATYGGLSLHFHLGMWMIESVVGWKHAAGVFDSEAESLACMTLLRALLAHTPYIELEPEELNLESLCLCLLRARGHVESGKE